MRLRRKLINENLPSAEINALKEILDEFRDVFAFDASELSIIEEKRITSN
jgi:hypothetical protein